MPPEDNALEADPEIEPGRPLQGKTVLIVEDQYLIAVEAQTMVEEAGADNVLLAGSVEEALSLTANRHIDVVVLDLLVADGTVQPLMAHLQQRRIPFVIASGYDVSEEPITSVPIVRKLYDAAALVAAILMALRGRP